MGNGRMEPINYGGVLLKRWWLPVALGFVCALAAVLLIPGSVKAFGCQGFAFHRGNGRQLRSLEPHPHPPGIRMG